MTSSNAPDELELVDIAFYEAVRAGLIVPTGTTDSDGDAQYDLTEIGKVRAHDVKMTWTEWAEFVKESKQRLWSLPPNRFGDIHTVCPRTGCFKVWAFKPTKRESVALLMAKHEEEHVDNDRKIAGI